VLIHTIFYRPLGVISDLPRILHNGSQNLEAVGMTTDVPITDDNASIVSIGTRQQAVLPMYDLVIHATVESLIALVITGGNSIVLVSILLHGSLRTVNNMFVTSLAIADLIMGVIVSPLRIYMVYLKPIIYGELTQSRLTCQFRLFFQNISFGVSLYSLCGIALDRYIAIVHPLKYKNILTHRRAGRSIVCIWIYIILLSAVPFLVKDSVSFEDGDTCLLNQVVKPLFFTFAKVHVFLAIFLTVTAHTIVAVIAARTNAKIKAELVSFNNNIAVAHRNESRIAKAMISVVGVFLICWLPQTIASFIKLENEPAWYKSLYCYLIALLVANSGMNPWIYAIKLKRMREAMKNVVQCGRP
ncbi:unnamed protein product, partial [Owenia fusiformis]